MAKVKNSKIEKMKEEMDDKLMQDVFNIEGKIIEQVKLNPSVFNVKINPRAIYQVYWAYNNNARTGSAHTKTRAEVSGGGKKPWKQKHTGRARQGSIRSPIWVGGGITFGPRKNRNYKTKINAKTRDAVLKMILSSKYQDKEIRLIDNLIIVDNKTRNANKLIENIFAESGIENNTASILIAIDKSVIDKSLATKAFRNIENVNVIDIKNVSVLDLMRSKYLFLDKDCLKNIETRILK